MTAFEKIARSSAVGLVALLAGCESMQGVRVAGSVVGGPITSYDVNTNDSDGEALGGRLQISQTVRDLPEIEMGIRVDGMVKEADDSSGGLTTDMEGAELNVAPTLRWRPFAEGGAVQPFVEGFVGYNHSWFDITRTSGSLSIADDGSAGGLVYGVGGGLEFGSAGSAFQVGIEFLRIDSELNGSTDVDETRFQGFAGLIFSF